jgi:ribosome-associated heat shock protein Hsp15
LINNFAILQIIFKEIFNRLVVNVRIDKWLWAVRIYKTRAQATDACKKNRILINGKEVKPSKELKTGEIVTIRKPPVIYNFVVKGLTNNRLPAKFVSEYLDDSFFYTRDRGTGRPTKKERRDIDKLKDDQL